MCPLWVLYLGLIALCPCRKTHTHISCSEHNSGIKTFSVIILKMLIGLIN
ncbi:rCG25759 [Rattus norvegicus]|uniref:RCG25759 n=1 Tax=Rattus norvegicus TaxID=10116 RepID=A6I297_RAT|nr:rCG25759 [Rattus norvegicus]